MTDADAVTLPNDLAEDDRIRLRIDEIIDALRALARMEDQRLTRGKLKAAYEAVHGRRVIQTGMNPLYRAAYEWLFDFRGSAQSYLFRGKSRETLDNRGLAAVQYRHLEKMKQSLAYLKVLHDIDLPSLDGPTSLFWPFLDEVYRQITAKPHPHAGNRGLPRNEEGSSHSVVSPELLGVARLFRDQLRDYFREYLSTTTRVVPFGGRTNELGTLNSWLDNPAAAPRLLLTAPSGRGKSALLVNWLISLARRPENLPQWHLAFVPISMLSKTNRPACFLRGIALRLQEIIGEHRGPDIPATEQSLRDTVHSQLETLAKSQKLVLVVLDGLDEAPEHSFRPSFIPDELPPSVRIVISARTLAHDQHNTWYRRLGWDRHVSVHPPIHLKRLKTPAVSEILRSLAAPEALLQDQALIARLAELTLGEPLLARFYAEDLLKSTPSRTDEGFVRITRQHLERLTPGFTAYFELWFELQEPLWCEAEVSRDLVDMVLSVLAFALGRLEATDLRYLLRHVHGFDQVIAEQRLLSPLRRFIIGDGRPGNGYVLSHLKLGDWLREASYEPQAAKIIAGFVEWGKEHLRSLNDLDRPLPSERASRYALQHLRYHFETAQNTMPSLVAPTDWMMLVEDGWRRAWNAWENGLFGFASDVEAVASVLRQQPLQATLSYQWRCALALSSIRSMTREMPPDLVLAALDAEIISFQGAAHVAACFTRDIDGVLTLAELSQRCETTCPTQAASLLSSAISRATASMPWTRTAALLAATVRFVPKHQAADIAGRAFELIRDELSAPHLPVEDVVDALTCLREHLSVEQQAEACISIAKNPDGLLQAQLLQALAANLVPDLFNSSIACALNSASQISDEIDRFHALRCLAPWLSKSQLFSLLEACSPHDPYGHVQRLQIVIRTLDIQKDHTLSSAALDAAMGIGDEVQKVNALVELVPHLAPEQRRKVSAEARRLGSPFARGIMLATLARNELDQKRANHLAETAIKETSTLDIPREKIKVVRECLHLLSAGQILDLVNDFKATSHDWAYYWSPFAGYLSTDLQTEVLHSIKSINNPSRQIEALAHLAAYLPPVERNAAIEVALRIARSINDIEQRASALSQLVPSLHGIQIKEALKVASAIEDAQDQVHALMMISRFSSGERKPRVIADAYSISRRITEKRQRLGALCHIIRTSLDTAISTIGCPGEKIYKNVSKTDDYLAGFLREGLDPANEIDERRYSEVIGFLCPYFSASQQARVMEVAGRCSAPYRTFILGRVVSRRVV